VLPDDAKTHYDVGVLHADLGQFDAARRHLARSLEIEPNSPAAHDRLGQVLSAASQFESALDHRRHAMRLDASQLHYRTHAAAIAEEYLEQLRRRSESAARVTDKMPTNFRHLGLIALLFPRARVVHVIRDPLDVCVSCMKQNLEWPYCDLQSVGSYYRRYEQLMRYWRGTLNLRILDVRYEELIADPETNGRRMIEFCGLPWEDACLDFTGRDRAVQTPSKWQVRQPIYTSSIGSWRAYEKHLGALRVALGLTSGES
jgi:tetratricopeptide (TPR) repeat protein